MTFPHPETGELLDSREDFAAALDEINERMQPLRRIQWALWRERGERFDAAEIPAPRYRTLTQEKVARCPRCGERLEAVPGCPCRTCCRLRGESEEAP